MQKETGKLDSCHPIFEILYPRWLLLTKFLKVP